MWSTPKLCCNQGEVPQLAAGCYFALFRQVTEAPVVFGGTIRVEETEEGLRISGDLYEGLPELDSKTQSNEIPIFPLKQYKFYLQGTSLISVAEGFDLGLSFWGHGASNEWQLLRDGVARLRKADEGEFIGELSSDADEVLGYLSIRFVSTFLRRATIHIDRVSGVPVPLDNGNGLTWNALFAEVGWLVEAAESSRFINQPSGHSWSNSELNKSLSTISKRTDSQWIYHVMCVRLLDGGERGLLYDAGATDTNKLPREGVAVAADWPLPDMDKWRSSRKHKVLSSSKSLYFRTAVHEVGHAMSLQHSVVDSSIMCATDMVAARAKAGQTVEQAIEWRFNEADAARLRHWPDVVVRPGGIKYGVPYKNLPEKPRTLELSLAATATNVSVPLGAPVRLELALSNRSTERQQAPMSLSFKENFVQGHVVAPSGVVRSFKPLLVKCDTVDAIGDLGSGESTSGSLTIFSGANGPLFPQAGKYIVVIFVSWVNIETSEVQQVSSQVEIQIEPPADTRHAVLAARLLSASDILLAIAIPGDYFTATNSLIDEALSNEVLAPHYCFTAARRLIHHVGRRGKHNEKARQLLSEAVLTEGEKAWRTSILVDV